MMTRKDYKIIAQALHDADAPDNVVGIMAARLSWGHPRFDRDKFYDAVKNGVK